MTSILKINAEFREKTGSAESRRIRKLGKIPAVIYGAGKEQVYIKLNANEFKKFKMHYNLMSHIFDITINGKTFHALPKEIQYHPVTDEFEHIDFLHVTEESNVKTTLRIVLTNKEKAPGIKLKGTLTTILKDIEVLCHPQDIPEYLEIDISELNLGQTLHLSDLKLPEGIKLVPKKKDLAVVAIVANKDSEEETKAE